MCRIKPLVFRKISDDVRVSWVMASIRFVKKKKKKKKSVDPFIPIRVDLASSVTHKIRARICEHYLGFSAMR